MFLPLLLLLLGLLTAEQPVGYASPVAVGDHALYLTGSRPPSNPNDIDQSGYVEVPYSTALNPSGGAITIEAWVKRNETNRNETIVGNGWQTSYWLGFSSTGKLRFIPHGFGSIVDGNSAVPSGQWVHVAVTYDGVTRRYYINGILDTISTANPGPITPASSGNSLGIGFDRNDFTTNYFGGWIDNVRIWNKVRSAAEIRAGMFQSFGAPHAHLLAEWSFDGNANDPAGGHNGILRGAVQFGNEGAIPHDIRVPQVSVTPSLDGFCHTDSEYANAIQVTVDGTAVYLLHTADDMWVCFDGLGGLPGDTASRAAMVYLDADYTRLDPAQPEHIQLRVNSDGTTQAFEGAGDGNYTDTTQADGKWAGKYMVCCGEFPTRRAEFRISADLLHGWNHVIGLALGKRKVEGGGWFSIIQRHLWPALAKYNLPSTWSSATLGGAGAARTFSGRVVYDPPDVTASYVDIPGVTVNLIGSDPNGGEAIVATGKSSLDGSFSLTSDDDYTHHRLELGAPPKGYLAKQALANPPGAVIDARAIDYGTAGSGTYPDNTFVLGDNLPYVVDPSNGPYFLIVASQHIIESGVLDEFVNFKRRLGFAVEVISVETVDSSFSGPDRMHKIRALEQARLATKGDRFRYVMLVGPHDVIPFAQFTPTFKGSPSLDACDSPAKNENWTQTDIPLKLTDWFYADLVSNFDTNGNGCLLDGISADPTEYASGYAPDARPTFQATVAVGRIPFDTESAVHTALTNSMHFEQQSEAFKRRVLHAMSYFTLKGQYWAPYDDPNGSYHACPGKGVPGVNKNCSGVTTDAAYVSEEGKSSFLNAGHYLSTIFYESAKPPGASSVVSPQPLTVQNVRDELEAQAYGFVNLAGHGNSSGVWRTVWWSDLNSNGIVDSPSEPPTSGDEIGGDTLLTTSWLNTLTPDNGYGAIYDVEACSTGNPLAQGNFGATLLEQGHGIAWVGALSMSGGTWGWKHPNQDGAASVQYYVMEKLLGSDLRLGDAVWQTLAQEANKTSALSAQVTTDLYGDPTLSYWGNPGGQSTLAAWPMLRYDARGQGYTPLAGPEVPKKLWEYPTIVTTQPLQPPSPVVSNNGEVIVAHGSYVDVLRQGSLYQRLNLDASAYGTPAISADGTIYVLDVTNRLYAFPYSYLKAWGQWGYAPTRYRAWTLDLNASPATSPVIGADGFIAVGTWNMSYGTVALVRPDGTLFKETIIPGAPVTALAVDANRIIHATTSEGASGGSYVQVDFFCGSGSGVCMTPTHFPTFFSTPPLLAYGMVYAGRGDNVVINLSTNETFVADGKITAGPIAGPAGQILVGTDNGTLYSLTKHLALRWQRNVGSALWGEPAYSADALYIVTGDRLRAYNPFSGAELWVRNLGSGIGYGSVAVGYGREIYLHTSGNKVFAYGEGWVYKAYWISAEAVKVNARIKGVKIEWRVTAPPPDEANATMPPAVTAQSTSPGVLLQRRTASSQWEDVAVLPPGTTAFTDTNVLENTIYAYRVQVLDSEGNDSGFTTTMTDMRSLPPLPTAPTLLSATAMAADALRIEWSSPASDLVSAYRVERSLSATGPFTEVLQTGGGVTTTIDTGLTPGTTYFYRVVAINGTGESAPSNVLSGTTRQRSLPAPQNATATLLSDGRIQISWTGGPVGASTVIEYSIGAMADYKLLTTTDAVGPYAHYPGEPNIYVYRLKFVKGDTESAYAETGAILIEAKQAEYLPLILAQPILTQELSQDNER
jgi:hypothetical protein